MMLREWLRWLGSRYHIWRFRRLVRSMVYERQSQRILDREPIKMTFTPLGPDEPRTSIEIRQPESLVGTRLMLMSREVIVVEHDLETGCVTFVDA
jgi:hypothetical protein